MSLRNVPSALRGLTESQPPSQPVGKLQGLPQGSSYLSTLRSSQETETEEQLEPQKQALNLRSCSWNSAQPQTLQRGWEEGADLGHQVKCISHQGASLKPCKGIHRQGQTHLVKGLINSAIIPSLINSSGERYLQHSRGNWRK